LVKPSQEPTDRRSWRSSLDLLTSCDTELSRQKEGNRLRNVPETDSEPKTWMEGSVFFRHLVQDNILRTSAEVTTSRCKIHISIGWMIRIG
jgi:hypothetical protein